MNGHTENYATIEMLALKRSVLENFLTRTIKGKKQYAQLEANVIPTYEELA
jgi:hypothetical protein